MLCKGCRKQGKSSRVLEPFRRYNLAWSGRSDLKTLTRADEDHVMGLYHDSQKLYCGLYLNELLMGIVRAGESEPGLFDLYNTTLQQLTVNQDFSISTILRHFELKMLEFMGYGISLEFEEDGLTPIDPEATYGLQPEQGLYKTAAEQHVLARGDSIIALNNGCLTSARQEREARNLTRRLIGYYLPDTRIQSRKLFV